MTDRTRNERRSPPAPEKAAAEKAAPMPFEARLAAARLRRQAALAAGPGHFAGIREGTEARGWPGEPAGAVRPPGTAMDLDPLLGPPGAFAGVLRPAPPPPSARRASRRRARRRWIWGFFAVSAAALAGLAFVLPERPGPLDLVPAGPGPRGADLASADPGDPGAATAPRPEPVPEPAPEPGPGPGPERPPATAVLSPPAGPAAEGPALAAAGGPPADPPPAATRPSPPPPDRAAPAPPPPAAGPAEPAAAAPAAPRDPLAGLDGGALRVFVYHPRGLDPGRVARLVETLRAGGIGTVVAMPVGFRIDASDLRFYHAQDRAAATQVWAAVAALAGPGGAAPQDFTDFVPPPRPGTLAIWLAGSP